MAKSARYRWQGWTKTRDKELVGTPPPKWLLPPTEAQLSYIDSLAKRAGHTAPTPANRREAKWAIDSLKEAVSKKP